MKGISHRRFYRIFPLRAPWLPVPQSDVHGAKKTSTKGRPCLLWVQEAACIMGLGGTGSSLLFPVFCIKKRWHLHLPVSLTDYWAICTVNSCAQLFSHSTSSKGKPEFSSSVFHCCLSSDTRLMKVEEKRRQQRWRGERKGVAKWKSWLVSLEGGFPQPACEVMPSVIHGKFTHWVWNAPWLTLKIGF